MVCQPLDRWVCVWRWRTSLELVPLISTKLGLVARPAHQAHFSGAFPAPAFLPVEPRAPLSLLPGGQSSLLGGSLDAGSSEDRSLGLRPRFFPPDRFFFFSFLGIKGSWLLCLEGGSAEVRNQF